MYVDPGCLGLSRNRKTMILVSLQGCVEICYTQPYIKTIRHSGSTTFLCHSKALVVHGIPVPVV